MNRYNFRFSLLFSICLLIIKAETKYQYETILDHDNKVQLKWNIKDKTIRFKLILLSIDYPIELLTIGFGMSNRGEFTNAEFILFEIDHKDLTLNKGYTNSDGLLLQESHNTYSLISTMITSDQIELEFERSLDTCDPKDYRIETGTVHLLHFIYRNKIQQNFKPKENSQQADMKQTQLIKSNSFHSTDTQTNKQIELTNSNIQIPKADTTYWCKVFKLSDEFTHKHHITAFESIITETSKGVVHHMEVFHCVTNPRADMATYNGPCNSEAKPAGLTQCRKVIAAWAMGATKFIYPSDVGGVIGGPNYSPYLVLEIHYDNPHLRTNIIDSSGMRIFYQGGSDEKLRTYDAGILEIGLEYNGKMAIPPQMNEFHLNAHCLSECTKASLTNGPITIFASQLHTHLTGRRVWTSLIRNNKIVEILNSDNHYDQMFQEIRLLRKPVSLLPGDSLLTQCVYQTTDRVNMTLGGFSIRDEMCVNYLHYYPLLETQLEVCKSSISGDVLNSFFDKMNKYDLAKTDVNNKTIRENFNEIRWTPLTGSILSSLYDIAPIAFSCNSSHGVHISKAYQNNRNGLFEVIKLDNEKDRMSLKQNWAPVDHDLLGYCNM